MAKPKASSVKRDGVGQFIKGTAAPPHLPRPKKPIPPTEEVQLTDDLVQLGARVPRSLLAALDFEAELLKEQCPGVEFTRSDGLRSLLSKSLTSPAHLERVQKARIRMEEEQEWVQEQERVRLRRAEAAAERKEETAKRRRQR